MTTTCDVAIIGAGPYGLSAAAYLRKIRGLEVRIFGEPMSFWAEQMPVGMLLRSPYMACQIADPDGECTLDAFRQFTGAQFSAPVPLDHFVRYGQWVQERVAPGLERRQISCVERNGEGFRLVTSDGENFKSRRVIVAGGIGSFAKRPAELNGLPQPLALHTADLVDPRQFAGRTVLSIGGGQSSLETAALLHESGAEVEVIVRSPVVHWLRRIPWAHKGLIGRILYAPSDVGQAGFSHIVEHPNLFRRLPHKMRHRLRVRPAGADWLVPRLKDVLIRTGLFVTKATPQGDRVRVRFMDGTERIVDTVVAGTGYRIDISRYPFLSRELLGMVEQLDGYPKLDRAFESSVLGLHFLGAPSAWTFGPLMRHVAGTKFSSSSLLRRISRKAST